MQGDEKVLEFLNEQLTAELTRLRAAIAAQISIQYINLPPIRLPKTLVSLGSTSSFMIVKLSEAFFSSIAKQEAFPIPWEQLYETTRATIELDRAAWGRLGAESVESLKR